MDLLNKRPQIEDTDLSFLKMPLTKDLRLKKRKKTKPKMNEIFKTDKSLVLEPVCKTIKKVVKDYEVK